MRGRSNSSTSDDECGVKQERNPFGRHIRARFLQNTYQFNQPRSLPLHVAYGMSLIEQRRVSLVFEPGLL